MARAPLGPALDRMGVSADLRPGDHVTDAVVLLKVETDEGEVAVVIEHCEHTNWYDQRALITAASAIIDRNELKRR